MQGTTFRQTIDAAMPHAARFSDLVRSLGPDEASSVVPGLGWTALEVAAHVATVLERYVGNHTRSSTRQDLARQNSEEMRILADSGDPGSIADVIERQMDALAAVAPTVPLDMEVPFHLDLTVTIGAGWANLLSEFLVHGDDICRAAGREWPFAEGDVEGIWRLLFPVSRGWLRPEARSIDEVYELRFDAFGPVTVWIHDGTVTVDDAARPSDHAVEIADAVEYTLAVPWRRRLAPDPVSALLLSRFYDI